MTEIPEHLRKRAQEARAKSAKEDAVKTVEAFADSNDLSLERAQAIMWMADRLDATVWIEAMPEHVQDAIIHAERTIAAAKIKRKAALKRTLEEFQEKYGKLSEEDMKELFG